MTDDPSTPRSSPGRSAFLAALIAAAVVYLCCLAWLPSFERRLNPLTGDEPFYVMTSISLIEDHDLDEQNNYDQRDFHRFYPAFGPTANGWPSYPDPLPPHQSHTKRAGLYSKHGLGMAVLVAVPYKLGGRTLTLIVLSGIAALLAANMTFLAANYTQSTILALSIALAFSLTNPLFSFSLLIFPELTAALLLTYANRRLLLLRSPPHHHRHSEPAEESGSPLGADSPFAYSDKNASAPLREIPRQARNDRVGWEAGNIQSDPNSAWQWFVIGSCAAGLPWLHYRLAPISVMLAVVALVLNRRNWSAKSAIAAATPPVVSAALLLWWYLRLYDSPLPPSSDHAGFSGVSGTLNGLAGTFLDQQWGAYVHNPLLVLATAAFIPFSIANRRDATVLAAIVVPYLFVISNYRVWWGEWNPPARYLTDVVPLAVIPLSWWLGQIRERWRWPIFAIVVLPALAISATFISDPQRMYNHPDGTSRLLETWKSWIGLDLTRFVPSYVFYSASPSTERIVFALLALACLGTLATVAHALLQDAEV